MVTNPLALKITDCCRFSRTHADRAGGKRVTNRSRVIVAEDAQGRSSSCRPVRVCRGPRLAVAGVSVVSLSSCGFLGIGPWHGNAMDDLRHDVEFNTYHLQIEVSEVIATQPDVSLDAPQTVEVGSTSALTTTSTMSSRLRRNRRIPLLHRLRQPVLRLLPRHMDDR